MAWCRQATSHYLSQYCPRPLSPYGVTRPQWFNILKHEEKDQQFAHWLINVYFIFLNKHHCILIEISLKFVPNGLYRQQVITWTNDECFSFKGNYFYETMENRHYLNTIKADGLVIYANVSSLSSFKAQFEKLLQKCIICESHILGAIMHIINVLCLWPNSSCHKKSPRKFSKDLKTLH